MNQLWKQLVNFSALFERNNYSQNVQEDIPCNGVAGWKPKQNKVKIKKK